MGLVAIILMAIGLSFDSFAVSVCTGLIVNKIKFWQATKIALTLALFQSAMPLLGWLIGMQFEELVKDFDHWIAFGLLLLIGARMIYESLKPEEERKVFNPFKPMILIGMAISTSIDALSVGITFAFIEINLYLAVIIIGIVTYISAMLGMLFGKKAGKWFGKRIEIVGGLILIGIGIKILLDSLYA
jgi:putative Mn2+ efflux pump MntP